VNLSYKILVSLIIFVNVNLVAQVSEISLSNASNGQTFSTCQSLFLDSGGQTGEYSNNESYVITICPDSPGDVISIFFTVFSLDPTDLIAGPTSNADRIIIYDGDNTSATIVGEGTGDQYAQYIFKATPINPSGCLTIQFLSNNIGTGNFSFLATCTTPCADPIAGGRIIGGITNDSIRVCIGESVQFEQFNSFAQPGFNLQNYLWDFADGTTATGISSTHSYSEGGYYRVQLYVTDDNGCNNKNLIDLQVLVATQPNFDLFMKDTTICIGESLMLTAEPKLYENTWTSGVGSIEIENGCMYDSLTGISQDVDLLQTNFISGITITDISQIENICFEMEHTFIGDLIITLYCPNGQFTILHQQGGGGVFLGEAIDDNIAEINCDDPSTIGIPYNYCFSVNAPETWVDFINNNGIIGGTPLPEGSYAAVGDLTDLVGCPANGIWTLSVIDNFAADDGKVFSFELDLADELYADIISFTPQHSTPSDSSFWHFPVIHGSNLSADANSLLITPTSTGTFNYSFTIVNDFGCSNDASINVTVFEVQLPFTLQNQEVCAGVPFLVGGDFQPCQYTLRLEDSFGDGWNNNFIQVSVNGSNIGSYTITENDNNGEFLEIPLNLNQNDIVTFLFDGLGSWLTECSYQLIDCNGNIVFSDGGDFTAPQTTLQTHQVNMQGGEAGYSFSWTPANLFNNPTLPVPTATVYSNSTLTMSYFPTDHPACVVQDQLQVTILPDSYAGLDSIVGFCTNDPIIDLTQFLGLNISLNGTWTAPNGSFVTMPIDLSNNLQGAFTYSVGSTTCQDDAIITSSIVYEPEMQTNFTTIKDICIGQEAVFLNSAVFSNLQSMTFSLGDTSAVRDITGNYDSVVYIYPYIGTYDVNVNMISNNGCIYQDFYDDIIAVHAYPNANFNYTPDYIDVLNPILTVTDASTLNMSAYSWNFEGALTESSENITETITYPFIAGLFPIQLKITNEFGCQDSITKMIKINDISLIYFPNSFTPNDDEFNQTWKIVASGIKLDQFNLKIFNRWGQVIFETFDPEVGWDGTFGNVPVQNGMYTWVLEAIDANTNSTIEKQGHINLLR
jgi:gliding motility-associated-like protein